MTQVVAPSEGHVVHNRLTHVLEVAQIGRRIAERLLRTQPKEVAAIGGIDPNVVESAALAHDLGHPPFGHIAEEELDKLVTGEGVTSGFEGNAQSFRVITKLAVRRDNNPGLDLTRATLAATLKYPWSRDASGYRQTKFGYYPSEKEDFNFARQLEHAPGRQTVEASLMDLADDIAYSLSDLEDFIRAGRISLSRIKHDTEEQERFVTAADVYLKPRYGTTSKRLQKNLKALLTVLPIDSDYAGTVAERASIRRVSSVLMSSYINAISIETKPKDDESYISLASEYRTEIALLKYLTFHYVICDPGLALVQQGQRTIIRGLFEVFSAAATSLDKKDRSFFPKRLTESIAAIKESDALKHKECTIRCIADFIAAMSDREAVDLYQQVHGLSARSILRSIF